MAPRLLPVQHPGGICPLPWGPLAIHWHPPSHLCWYRVCQIGPDMTSDCRHPSTGHLIVKTSATSDTLWREREKRPEQPCCSQNPVINPYGKSFINAGEIVSKLMACDENRVPSHFILQSVPGKGVLRSVCVSLQWSRAEQRRLLGVFSGEAGETVEKRWNKRALD